MQTKMIDRTDEKIALAKEIGMNDWADHVTRVRQEVALLTNLKFKPINEAAIRKMLCKGRVFRAFHNEEGVITTMVTGGVGSLVSVMLAAAVPLHPLEAMLSGLAITAFICLTIFLFCSFPKIALDWKFLTDWKHNIPYGALLAVKEAKAADISTFRVYYPVVESRRVMADPVITGRLRNSDQDLMIFAWDDGKVYE